jgi:multimeric flavodoxin WrbA
MVTIIHRGHRKGLCFKAYNKLKHYLEEKKIETKTFSLHDFNSNFCCGDQPCQNSKMCIYEDIITNEIIPAITNSNALIFFTPTYFNMPPAILKNFIDRCNLLLTIEEYNRPKFGAWVSGQTEMDSLEENYKCLSTFANICELEQLSTGKILRIEKNIQQIELNEKDIESIIALAKEIAIV